MRTKHISALFFLLGLALSSSPTAHNQTRLAPGPVRGSFKNGASMNDFPLNPVDRKIDELGDERRIRSQEDAEAYVDAILEKFRIDVKSAPILAELKSKLVRAELAAVLHTESRIPETGIVRVFNSLMDEWQMPAWTRVNLEEFHAFRVTASLFLYPHSITRSPDGYVLRTCRPVEALYLIYLLHAKMGVPPEIREAVTAGRWTASDAQVLPPQGPFGLGRSRKGSIDIQRLRQYKEALANYVAAHPDFDFQDQAKGLFERLGIR